MEELKKSTAQVEPMSALNGILFNFGKELDRLYCTTSNINGRIIILGGATPENEQDPTKQMEPISIIDKLDRCISGLSNINNKLEECDNRLTYIVGKL